MSQTGWVGLVPSEGFSHPGWETSIWTCRAWSGSLGCGLSKMKGPSCLSKWQVVGNDGMGMQGEGCDRKVLGNSSSRHSEGEWWYGGPVREKTSLPTSGARGCHSCCGSEAASSLCLGSSVCPPPSSASSFSYFPVSLTLTLLVSFLFKKKCLLYYYPVWWGGGEGRGGRSMCLS